MLAWIVTIASLALIWFATAWRSGPRAAVAAVTILSCAVPTWCRIDLIDSLPLEARMVGTLFALVAYCFHPLATFPIRLCALDVSMLCLLAVHAVSDITNSGWNISIPFRIYGEWCVPYLAGRLAFCQLDTLRVAAPLGTAVALFLAFGGILQAITKINIWELAYGERFLDGIGRDMQRWGMLRAWGCCGHPIYFGLLQVSFLPWLMRDWFAGLGTKNQKWLWILPAIGLMGIVCSTSRGPVLSALFTIAMSGFVLSKNIRPALTLVLIASVFCSVLFREQLMDGLHIWAGERVDSKLNPTVVINDETVQLTSTAYRVHLLNAFRNAVARAGWFGFGTESVTGFPIHIPLDAEELTAIQKVKFIDNEYLLLALRFGWLGVGFFTLAIVLATCRWLNRRKASSWIHSAWCAFVGSSIAGISFCLMTVWMPQDVGFPLLLMIGACSATPRKKETVDLNKGNRIAPTVNVAYEGNRDDS